MSDARFAVFRPSLFLEDRYHDGDTWWFEIDLGYDSLHRAMIRIIGYDAPERTTPLGPAATAFSIAELKRAREIMVKTTERQSGRRWLGFVQVDGADLAVILQAGKLTGYNIKA